MPDLLERAMKRWQAALLSTPAHNREQRTALDAQIRVAMRELQARHTERLRRHKEGLGVKGN